MDQDFTLLGPSGTKNNPVFNGDMKIIGGDAYTQVEDDGTGGTKVATVDDVVKPITVQLDTVTNTSGSYTHTTQTNYVVASMKPIQIECSNPSAFQDDITVTTANGSITLSCSSVSGTSDVTVTLMKSVLDGEADPEALNPSEFDVLAGRIGNLQSLTTTAKSSVVGAVNEVNSKLTQHDTAVDIRSYVNLGQGCSLYGAYYRNGFVTIWGGTDKFNAAGSKTAITSMSAYMPRVGAPGTITGGYATGNAYPATGSDSSYNSVSIKENGKLEVYWGKETTYGVYYSITFPAYPPIA